MAIEAIVANMDPVWNASGEADRAALERFLQGMRDDGYPLLLVSDLNATSLNEAITERLGDEGITYFSSILASHSNESRYAVALHTLEIPANRVAAVGAQERGFAEARNSGITHCIALRDVLRHGTAPFSRHRHSDR